MKVLRKPEIYHISREDCDINIPYENDTNIYVVKNVNTGYKSQEMIFIFDGFYFWTYEVIGFQGNDMIVFRI